MAGARSAFAPLCELHRLVRDLQFGVSGISRAIEVLDASFPSGQARAARHEVLLTASRSARQLDPRSLNYLVDHLSAISTQLSEAEMVEVGSAIWASSPRRLMEMVSDPVGKEIVEQFLRELPAAALIDALPSASEFLPEIIALRPDIIARSAFWSLEGVPFDPVWETVDQGSPPTLEIANALVMAGRYEFARTAVQKLGANAVGQAVLGANPIIAEDRWLPAILEDRSAIADLFVKRAAKRASTLIIVARATNPGDLPNLMGQDPWDCALASVTSGMTNPDLTFLQSYLLSRVLGKNSASAEYLCMQTFEPVVSALSQSTLSSAAWELIERRLAWPLFPKSRSSRLISAVADFVVDNRFRPGSFDRLARSDAIWRSLVESVALTSRGRDYLRTVKKEMKRTDDRKYSARIKIIDRAL